ncbi:MAG: orotidine-5'-phosphate decarboxylase [Polyangiaceae bacterium]|nr:orotidine-5'-phosphate decarboxylase [Polyangiaceae bacterium]
MLGTHGAARERLCFALDYASLDDALIGARAVAPYVGKLKVGLELFSAAGPEAVRQAAALGCELFLDLKLHDIPETVERAVAATRASGAAYLTVHASGGPAMLAAAARRAEREGGPTLLAVTVLTSLDAADLAATGVPATPADQVRRLARVAREAGIPGLVCSAAEVAGLRALLGPEVQLVTPGIRPAAAPTADQKRVATPSEALRAGASWLVVGRPLRDAPDPAAAAQALLAEVAGVAAAG